MSRKPVDQLGDLQRVVLECLWDLEAATVQTVVDRLAAARRRPAYTTVLTTLQNLEKSGWVRHQKQGRSYLYRPTRSRSEAGTSSIRAFVKRAFGGDPYLMFESLLDDEQLSTADLKRLRDLVEKKSREVDNADSRSPH